MTARSTLLGSMYMWLASTMRGVTFVSRPSVKRMLKPGGKLLIVDHNAPAGTGKEMAGKLHRLNEDWARKSLEAHGFAFEKAYDGLRNKSDQLDKHVYDPAVKGKTDRYVHLYRVK